MARLPLLIAFAIFLALALTDVLSPWEGVLAVVGLAVELLLWEA